jgi:hypothetical protein
VVLAQGEVIPLLIHTLEMLNGEVELEHLAMFLATQPLLLVAVQFMALAVVELAAEDHKLGDVVI